MSEGANQGDLARDVAHRVKPRRKSCLKLRRGGDVAFDISGCARHVLPASSRFVINDHDSMAESDQSIGEMRADESGASGYENVHGDASVTKPALRPVSTART